MNRFQIANIVETAERVLREEAHAAVLAKPIAKSLEREYRTAQRRVKAAEDARRAVESKAKRVGLQFHTSYYGGGDGGGEHVKVGVASDRVPLSAKQRRLKELRSELEIARMATGPEAIKEQQAIFRAIAKLAPAR